MKEIISEIKDFLKKDFNVYAYLYTLLFLTISLFLNYKYNFENSIIDSFYGQPISFLIYFLYYSAPYLLILIPVLAFKNKLYLIRNPEFWIKSFIFFGIFGALVAFWQFRYFIDFSKFDYSDSRYIRSLIFNIKRIIPFLIVFYAVKLYYDKDMNHLYGLRYKGMDYRPFFLLLFLMIPLIALASFQPDFKISYPQYKFYYYDGALGMSRIQSEMIFLAAYGLDFVSTELMYRGALIVGMASILGRETVLPMAGAYVILHFGKPAGEAVSSFFGGMILGIHALAKQNILGGIIIHTGIAYFMETAAVLQHYYGS